MSEIFISQYGLGTSYPPTPLHLFSPVPIPVPMISAPIQYSVTFDRGDGSIAGHGHSYTIWTAQVLTEAEKNAYQAIVTVSSVVRKSRPVYIQTRLVENMESFGVFTAIMIWPDITKFRQPNGLYINVPFEFRKLVLYP